MEDAAIVLQQVHHMAIIRCTGELDVATAEQLETLVDRLPHPGIHALVVDLERVTFMDVCTINLLTLLSARCRQAQIGFRLCNVPAGVRRTIELLQLEEQLLMTAYIGDALEQALTETASRPADVHYPVLPAIQARFIRSVRHVVLAPVSRFTVETCAE